MLNPSHLIGSFYLSPKRTNHREMFALDNKFFNKKFHTKKFSEFEMIETARKFNLLYSKYKEAL